MAFGKKKQKQTQNPSVALSPVQTQDEFSNQIYNRQIEQPIQQPVQQNQPIQQQPMQVQPIQQIQEQPVQVQKENKTLIISKELLADGEYKYTIVTTNENLDIGYCNLTQGA